MAELIAIGYPDETTALQALDEAQNLAADLIIETDAAAAIVRHADGKYQVTTKHGPTAGGGATWGMFWGLLFGLLFFVPLLGMAVGAAMGALTGSMADVGIDDDFIDSVRSEVQPGTSALFVMTSDAVQDKVRAAFSEEKPKLVHTDLSSEEEARLREYFSEED